MIISSTDCHKIKIHWNNREGPLLLCSDGSTHVLSKQEVLWLTMNLTTLEELNSKYVYHDCRA